MKKKRLNLIGISYDLLKEVLKLPDDVEIIDVHRPLEGYYNTHAIITIEGRLLDETIENCAIPYTNTSILHEKYDNDIITKAKKVKELGERILEMEKDNDS